MFNAFRQQNAPPAFIATLGLMPQVITRGLDSLLKHESTIRRATLIYTGSYRAHPNWPTFQAFQNDLTRHYDFIEWDWVPLQQEGQPILMDVDDHQSTEIAFRVIFQATKALKAEGYRLHSLIAGGRKSIIVYSMISAQLLFDPFDQLWHIFSDDERDREKGLRPHVDASVIHLAPIPVMHLGGLMPMVRELLLHDSDPTRAMHMYREHHDIERTMQLHRFYESCDPLDKYILWLRFKNHPNKEIADKVYLGEPAIINRLRRVAEAFYSDPILSGSRYTQLPPKPHRAVLIELRPVFLQMSEPPPPPPYD